MVWEKMERELLETENEKSSFLELPGREIGWQLEVFFGGGYVFKLLSFSVNQMSRYFNLNNPVQNIQSY